MQAILTGVLLALSLKVCGIAPLNLRIVGGEDAEAGTWPWQVSLHRNNFPFCGGSLITKDLILTAAHCFQGPGDLRVNLLVYLGRDTQQNSNPNEVSRTVSRIIVHPDYNDSPNNNDVCLLQLNMAVDFTDFITPVCLASSASSFPAGTQTWVTGWGTRLQEVQVPVVSNMRCSEQSSRSEVGLQDEGPCTIDVVDTTSLTHHNFLEHYAYRRPVILTGTTDNTKFRFLCSKTNLLGLFGDRRIRLSTANTHSYRKVDVSFQEYVDYLLKPQSADVLGSDTLYFFGDNNLTEWSPLLDHYQPPPFRLPGTSTAFSFGLAGPGTGVPFHWHGPGFSEVLYGRKRWFLYPPDQKPHFHPNRTTLSWLEETFPLLPPEEAPLQCTLRPGEVLFFPDRWWHATLNLDTSVFISTFLG
ncbi:hypothetical protein NHX12_032058 [Muraenolepis orangiensis]|uniref:chymotrypsin n=1 Tax=Muraenolepis orangiensis TaxID=630683 RepID=A0A9Q0E904_9TELE|nr:hypothetical protein NHX12_032058 [Muraenolepis orangiensis]